jgi:O-antigen ligase
LIVRTERLSTRWLALGIAVCAVPLGVLAGYDPPIAIAAVIGLVFAAISLLNLTAGTCIFAVLMFLNDALPVESFSLDKLLGILLILSWLATVSVSARPREKLMQNTGLIYLLVLFVAWAGLSAIWAKDSGLVFASVARYAPNAMLFPIVYTAAGNRKKAIWIVGAFVVGTLIAAAYGLVVPGEAEAEGRLSGSFGNANETAAALAVGVALAGGLVFGLREKPWLRFWAVLSVPFLVLALFLTVSRGGIVALGAVFIAAVLLAGPRRRGPLLAATVVAILAAVFYFGVVAGQDAKTHLLKSNGGTGRTDIWKVGWRMVEANPVVGVGAGNFQSSSVHYLLAPGQITHSDFIIDEPKVAHNTYLEVLAELGIVGLVLFLAIIAYSLIAALKAARIFSAAGDEGMEMISRALMVALAGYLTASFFGSREFSNQLWLLLALAPALLNVARMEWERQAPLPENTLGSGSTSFSQALEPAEPWALPNEMG